MTCYTHTSLFQSIKMNEILVTLNSVPFCMVAPSLRGGPTVRHWPLEVRVGGDSFYCSSHRMNRRLYDYFDGTIYIIPKNFRRPNNVVQNAIIATLLVVWYVVSKLAKISLSVKVNEDRRHIVVFVDKINFGFFDQNKFFYVKSQHQHHDV